MKSGLKLKAGKLALPENGPHGTFRQVTDLLNATRWLWIDLRQNSRLTPEEEWRSLQVKGRPDLVAVRFALTYDVLWIETKSTTGRLSKAQKAYHGWLEVLGYEVLVYRGDYEALKRRLA